jgi:hypothetical protein
MDADPELIRALEEAKRPRVRMKVVGLRNLRPGDVAPGTILVSKNLSSEGFWMDDHYDNEEQYYLRIDGKYPLVNLISGRQVHYSVADKMHLELVPPGAVVEISVPLRKVKIRARLKYVKNRANA